MSSFLGVAKNNSQSHDLMAHPTQWVEQNLDDDLAFSFAKHETNCSKNNKLHEEPRTCLDRQAAFQNTLDMLFSPSLISFFLSEEYVSFPQM